MVHYTTYYYRLPNGRVPVREFIDSLKTSTYRKFIFKKELLEEFGPKLPMPHAKYLGNKLYELRFKGEDGAARILYFFVEKKKIIFVHAFKKTRNKTSRKEIEMSQKRISDYEKK